jgi:hypothetical protein
MFNCDTSFQRNIFVSNSGQFESLPGRVFPPTFLPVQNVAAHMLLSSYEASV